MLSSSLYKQSLLKYVILVLLLWKSIEEFNSRTSYSFKTVEKSGPQSDYKIKKQSTLNYLFKTPVLTPPVDAPPHRLSIIFCKSCHANGLYQKIEQLVQKKVRWIQVNEGNDTDDKFNDDSVMIPLEIFPISGSTAPIYKFLSSCIGFLQLCLVPICLLGIQRCADLIKSFLPSSLTRLYLNESSIRFYDAYYSQYRWKILALTFFLGNLLRTMLTTSKAFELYLGQQLIYSKLATGSNPTVTTVLDALQNAGATVLH
jgi:hypothetical protein